MSWKIGEAKQRFSELIRRAAGEPQFVHNRERLVASVLGPEDTAAFIAFRQKSSIRETLADARRICEEDRYELELPPRVDRPNALFRVADARRHKRH
jgi:antitoxin (DNA-binding transcriptional repressor) of toxin-antitoxin stability system